MTTIAMLIISILISGCLTATVAVSSGVGAAYGSYREYITLHKDCEEDEKAHSWYCIGGAHNRGWTHEGARGGAVRGDATGVGN